MAQIDVSTPDALNASINKLLKPGAKTSEFIAMIAVWAGSLATLLGLFNTSSARFNAVLKIGALVAAAVSQVGYALSRGDTKAALGSVTNQLISHGWVVPTRSTNAGVGKVPTVPSDSGAVDLVGLVAGVLAIAGLIWLVVGFTHHTLDVFGLVLLLVGLGIFLLFGGAWRTRRRP